MLLLPVTLTTAMPYYWSTKVIPELQVVQNAAARLLSRTEKREHTIPVLFNLHWLPVYFSVAFKVCLMGFKALKGLAPAYISLFVHVAGWVLWALF